MQRGLVQTVLNTFTIKARGHNVIYESIHGSLQIAGLCVECHTF